MKSRLINAQNQRVERISTSTLVIGIDIAKEKHAAQAINFRGIVLTNRPITFSNDQSGYEQKEIHYLYFLDGNQLVYDLSFNLDRVDESQTLDIAQKVKKP